MSGANDFHDAPFLRHAGNEIQLYGRILGQLIDADRRPRVNAGLPEDRVENFGSPVGNFALLREVFCRLDEDADTQNMLDAVSKLILA